MLFTARHRLSFKSIYNTIDLEELLKLKKGSGWIVSTVANNRTNESK